MTDPLPPLTELPPPEDWIKTDEGRAEWARAGAILIAAGRLNEANIVFFGHYCALYGLVAAQRRAGAVSILVHELRAFRRDLGIPPPDDEP
jgi:hypothetical protein